MEEKYFSEMLALLASRASLGTISWLGFSNVPLRRHLMDVFARPYGDTGSFLADPTFEAVFGWALAKTKMRELAGDLLSRELVDAMDSLLPHFPPEYRFPKDRRPYEHQLSAWRILSETPPKSLVVTSGLSYHLKSGQWLSPQKRPTDNDGRDMWFLLRCLHIKQAVSIRFSNRV